MFEQAMARIAGRFRRVEPRATARAFVLGLLSGVERKNCWRLAEQDGHARPGPMQRLLRTARWDADALRDDVRAYVHEHLGADNGVLVVDETGFLKKGFASAGVQRQYTGTAGRIENSQVGVFLAYASSRGRALIDRLLYLPDMSWSRDAERRTRAGVPEHVEFATKPTLAGQMIAAALLRLDLDRDRRRRPPTPAGPPQPEQRRTRLLPVLVPETDAAVRAGQSGRDQVVHRGMLPGRERPGRTGSLPGPPLDRLASARHASAVTGKVRRVRCGRAV
ncbi:IS701 family transposase [Streptomyces griseoaurantiacus]